MYYKQAYSVNGKKVWCTVKSAEGGRKTLLLALYDNTTQDEYDALSDKEKLERIESQFGSDVEILSETRNVRAKIYLDE